MGTTGSDRNEPIPTNLTRRQYLKTAAAAGAAVAVPTIIPASALGRGGAEAPSERIRLGGIGIGNHGEDDLKWMLHESEVQIVRHFSARHERTEVAPESEYRK